MGALREISAPHKGFTRCLCLLVQLWCGVNQGLQSTTGFSWTTEPRKQVTVVGSTGTSRSQMLTTQYLQKSPICVSSMHGRPALAYLLPVSKNPHMTQPCGAYTSLPGASILALDLLGDHPVCLFLTPGWSVREEMF